MHKNLFVISCPPFDELTNVVVGFALYCRAASLVSISGRDTAQVRLDVQHDVAEAVKKELHKPPLTTVVLTFEPVATTVGMTKQVGYSVQVCVPHLLDFLRYWKRSPSVKVQQVYDYR